MTGKIQFGDNVPVDVKNKRAAMRKASQARDTVKQTGPESNGHTTYSHETRFVNIKPKVNVTRTKEDEAGIVGVLKGAILDNVPITVPSNTAGATTHAMKKRCDHAPHLTSIVDFKHGHGLLMAKFEPMPEIRVDEELVTKYLQKCGPGKSERLLEALGGAQLNSDMNTKHVFAKQEVLLKPWTSQPRVVYQGTDMYNALTGPIVMELNDRMKQVFSRSNPLNTGNTVIYACGARGEELGEIIGSAEGKGIESDATNNDGSQSKEFRQYEAMFYRKLGAPVWFVREFAATVSVRVWTRYGIAAVVDGQRWSGETTTTTGNSYVHMALIQCSLSKAGVERSTNIHGGDDYLGFVVGDEQKTEAAITAVYDTSGMKAEVVQQTVRHKATFYRKRYPSTKVGCLPVPQFGRVLSKLNIRANRNTNVNDRDYMAGKYLSAAYEHRHVPEIPELLVATAERLSATPHFDTRATKLAEMGGDAESVKSIIVRSKVHPVSEFSEFLNEVYGINHTDLVDVYAKACESCVEYCDVWTVVGANGKVDKRRGNQKYIAPVMSGDVVDALTRLDT